jgi:hypothetical protein
MPLFHTIEALTHLSLCPSGTWALVLLSNNCFHHSDKKTTFLNSRHDVLVLWFGREVSAQRARLEGLVPSGGLIGRWLEHEAADFIKDLVRGSGGRLGRPICHNAFLSGCLLPGCHEVGLSAPSYTSTMMFCLTMAQSQQTWSETSETMGQKRSFLP